uniref:Uncharacterized protein n=1 Tax=Siphoviridae sp. ctDCt3 TaxID=2825385 RepID=A0A8S5U264_9CAUD|nr:MAG TPA: hypothetical protein [Siphoviridae sp. ctDCt3]
MSPATTLVMMSSAIRHPRDGGISHMHCSFPCDGWLA